MDSYSFASLFSWNPSIYGIYCPIEIAIFWMCNFAKKKSLHFREEFCPVWKDVTFFWWTWILIFFYPSNFDPIWMKVMVRIIKNELGIDGYVEINGSMPTFLVQFSNSDFGRCCDSMNIFFCFFSLISFLFKFQKHSDKLNEINKEEFFYSFFSYKLFCSFFQNIYWMSKFEQ